MSVPTQGGGDVHLPTGEITNNSIGSCHARCQNPSTNRLADPFLNDEVSTAMSAVNQTFDPAKVRQLEAALDAAWAKALAENPDISHSDTYARLMRDKLARAIIEAARNGIADTAEMTEFALQALPGFRTPKRTRQGAV